MSKFALVMSVCDIGFVCFSYLGLGLMSGRLQTLAGVGDVDKGKSS